MSTRKFTALALGVLLLAGCGGGANLKFEEQLKADLAASEAQVAKLTQDVAAALETARQATEDAAEARRDATNAARRATEAEKKAADAEAARDADVARYRKEAEDAKAAEQAALQAATAAQAQADAALQQAQQAQQQQQQAQQQAEEARQQAQSAEAIQRARNLLAAFGVTATTAVPAEEAMSPVTMSVPSRNTLRFAQGDRSVSSISTPSLSGERGARLTRTRGGTDTTVVYTDRELTRALLDHYAAAVAEGATQIDIDDASPGGPGFDSGTTNFFPANSHWKVSHGFPSSRPPATAQADLPPVKPSPGSSFPGSLHGIPGQFICAGVAGCKIELTSVYARDESTDPWALTTVTMALASTPAGATLYFKPNSASASVSLGTEGIGSPGITMDDGQYMTFGWWGHEPASLNGEYEFHVFSDVTGGGLDITAAATTTSGTAEYDGTAVGLYVDQDATTARQGEFTAEVRLTADFGTSPSLEGVIDNFQTTPRGASAAPALSDSWVVELNSDGADVDSAPDARIRRTGSTSTGVWSSTFVPRHPGACAADACGGAAKPPAVTGTFDTEITNLLRIVGAYGAELQQ